MLLPVGKKPEKAVAPGTGCVKIGLLIGSGHAAVPSPPSCLGEAPGECLGAGKIQGLGGEKGIEREKGEKGLKEKGEKEKRNLRRWRTGLKEKREKRI